MYILLTGCTGVGKSTIMEQVSLHNKDVKLFSDPYINNPFISDAYTSEHKVLQSELFFIKEFFKIHKLINDLYKDVNIVQERSLFECIHVFSRLFLLQKKIDNNEYNLLEDLFNCISPNLIIPDVVIHLTASPLAIKERIEKRNRTFENSVDLLFIKQQQELYSEWLKKMKTNVLILDNTNKTIYQTYGIINTYLKDNYHSDIFI